MFLSGSPRLPSLDSSAEDLNVSESSILHPVLKVIGSWKTYRREKPTVLAATLTLLDKLWQHGDDHKVTLKKLRNDGELWKALIDLISEPSGNAEEESCYCYCYFQIAQAHALRLLASEAHLLYSNGPESERPVLNDIMGALCKSILRLGAGTEGSKENSLNAFPHNRSLTDVLQEDLDKLNSNLDIGNYRSIVWNDPFDSSRRYGPKFVYDVDLFRQKTADPFDAENTETIDLVESLICAINKNWSQTDSYMVMFRSFGFALRLLVSRIWCASRTKSSKLLEMQHVYACLSELLKLLSEHSDVTNVHLTYKAELSSLIAYVLGHWLPVAKAECSSVEMIGKLVEILQALMESMMMNVCSLGPAGYLSKDAPFREHVFSSFLLVSQALSELEWKASTDERQIIQLSKEIVPAICEGMNYLLFDSSDSEDSCDWGLSVLLALLYEITRTDKGIPLYIWRNEFEKYQLIPLLLHSFSQWSLRADDTLTAADSTAPEQTMELLLSLSGHPATAAILISHGLMGHFCHNTLTHLLQEGAVQVYTNGSRSQVHRVWCIMVSIVSQLLRFVEGDAQLFQYALGFSRLYQNQIVLAMQRVYNGGAISKGGIHS
jgi:hypothetical protein